MSRRTSVNKPPSNVISPGTADVPITLAHLLVTVTETGLLDATLDGQPLALPDGLADLDRSAFARLLDHVATTTTIPVRVEVVEVDGTRFTDIVTPQPAPPIADDPISRDPSPSTNAGGPVELSADGFVPAEQVAVAIVVAHVRADRTGHARLRLPARLLDGRPGGVALIGSTSGTLTVETTGTLRPHDGDAPS